MRSRIATSGAAFFASAFALLAVAAAAGAEVVDGFDDPAAWKALPADGVRLTLHADRGVQGGALRMDFDFQRGAGYAVIRRDLPSPLTLPENYQFRFRIRGAARPNTLEFKLVDSTGANVWWQRRPDVEFPAEWSTITVKRRHISFAWGPAGGGVLRRVAAIELAVTAGEGGTGSVWLDELELIALPPPDTTRHDPVAVASASAPGSDAPNAVDGSRATVWHTPASMTTATLDVDWGGVRELGGLVVDWDPFDYARDYTVLASADGVSWTRLRQVRGGNGGRDAMTFPETEARHVRLSMERASGARGFGVRELAIQPLEWSGARDSVVRAIAASGRRGLFPRWAYGEQSFWTVVGIDADEPEALLSEDGMLELDLGGPSVEPFLLSDNALITWADGKTSRSLYGDELPIPVVRRRHGAFELVVTAIPVGSPGRSGVLARYRVRNEDAVERRVDLLLAVRPFQVNPPWQFLGRPGGVAKVARLERSGATVKIDGRPRVVFSRSPRAWNTASFEAGEVIEHAERGTAPSGGRKDDPDDLASGLARFELRVPARGATEIALLAPLGTWTPSDAEARGLLVQAQALQDSAARRWRAALGDVRIDAPGWGMDLVRTMRATLGYVLVNRDGPALQPGSRAYDRSWIRDGALTSVALLRLGRYDAVREFIDWFAPYQYAGGKVPCCVDARGPDPVPEHDSHGELIFLIAEYARHTGDRAAVQRWWPHVAEAAAYLDRLRHERLTPEYDAASRREFRGLLPPSISHEGYSAKPMHSYWDDFFALRGLEDAAWLASWLGRPSASDSLERIAKAFRGHFSASIRAAMRRHKIDYVPGCADLGDFDATSTTVALGPLDVAGVAPPGAVRATFERYWKNFDARRRDTAWDAYTPYEWRAVGSAVRLGWRDRAHRMIGFLMSHRTPAEWQQWAEVVWRDARAPRFIGDLPHTWVGSDFIRSALDLFAYDNLADSTLVLGAGVPASWLELDSIAIRDLSTVWGRLSYRMGRTNSGLWVTIEDGIRVPQGGIVLRPPGVRAGARVRGEGVRGRVGKDGTFVVRKLPAKLTIAP